MRRITSAIGIAIALLSVTAPAVARSQADPLSIHAEQANGQYAVHVTGNGPASTIIHLYIAAHISSDLPAIPLGANDGYQIVRTDGSGHFSTIVSLATDYFQGSIVTIDANVENTSLHASTNYLIEAPSPNIRTKIDVVPSN